MLHWGHRFPELLAAVNLLEFGLSLGAAIAIDFQSVITLEFFDSGFERIAVGAVETASEVTEIVKSADLARDFIDGIEMPDLDGQDFVLKGSLIAADGENAFFGVEGDFLFELAVAVGRELEDLAVDEKGALGAGDGFFVDVFEDQAELQSFFVDGEGVFFVGGAGFVLFFHVGDEDLIAGQEDVGILALLFQVGVVGMIPNGGVVGETVVFGDFGEVIALFDGVEVSHGLCLD